MGENTGGSPGGETARGGWSSADTSEPKEIVARGYDAIALRYAQWAGQIDSPAIAWVRDLVGRLPETADILELGCGRGVPVTRELARSRRVVGVDISTVQIALARHHVPEAVFVHADAAELEIAPGSFDAVVALYVFGHVPAAEQADLIESVATWLRPGGLFLATLGADGPSELVEEWLGAPMFFAALGDEAYDQALQGAGFDVVRDEVVLQDEPGHGHVAFRWLLARGG